jgi:uncharacterized repeat protein (TIGR01451 family)
MNRTRSFMQLMLSVLGGALPAVVLLLLLAGGTAQAAGTVGNGTPGSCTEAALEAALAGGGSVSFNCGASPVTITVASQKVVALDTSVNGGGLVTLSGGGLTRTFFVEAGATLNLSQLRIVNGHAGEQGGGAIFSNGTLIIEASQFFSNTTTGWGGALGVYGQRLEVRDSVFAYNVADAGSGAIDSEVPLYIEGSVFYANRALNQCCGAIFSSGLLTLTNSALYDNQAIRNGGGMYSDGNSWLANVSFYGNQSVDGAGGLSMNGGGTLSNVNIYANAVVSGTGGGLRATSQPVTITNSAIYANQVLTGSGGGIRASGGAVLTIINSAIYNNQALSGRGGGLDASSAGGGATVSLLNTTVSGNAAGEGGGLFNNSNDIVLRSVTVASNTAATGANLSGGFALQSSLVTGGCANAVTSLGHNLDTGNTCGLSAITDLTNTAAGLAPLAANGGSNPANLTHALLPNSPAVDDGAVVGCPATDQRGFARPADGLGDGNAVCDIGAFELQPADLSLSKAGSPSPVFAGASLTYSLTVTNNGPSAAGGVVLTDTLPAGVAFGSAAASQGNCSGTSTVVCSLGALANGASASVTIVVTPTSAGELVNNAVVASSDYDANPANNSAAAVTTALGRLYLPLIVREP